MEIIDAKEPENYYIDDNGTISWCCPVCGEMWLQEEQGDFFFGYCEHLRFTLNSDLAPDDFEFSGDWDTKGFIDELKKTRLDDNNEDWDLFEALGRINHRDVTEAIFYQWHEDPMYKPWTLWGYKRD